MMSQLTFAVAARGASLLVAEGVGVADGLADGLADASAAAGLTVESSPPETVMNDPKGKAQSHRDGERNRNARGPGLASPATPPLTSYGHEIHLQAESLLPVGYVRASRHAGSEKSKTIPAASQCSFRLE